MLLAHAPAGYLLTRLLSRTIFKDIVDPKRSDRLYQLLMIVGIIGAIVPDFDFIYHIFIDSSKTPHHQYITHMPLFWLGMLMILVVIGKLRNNTKFIAVSTVGCLSAMLHLLCDTVTGDINWFYPFSTTGFNIFSVTNSHLWWVNNYMYHWTFLLEIAIIVAAMIIFLRVQETISYIIALFLHSAKLRAITLRIGVCVVGLLIVAAVGLFRFNVDNRILQKINDIKHHVIRMAFS